MIAGWQHDVLVERLRARSGVQADAVGLQPVGPAQWRVVNTDLAADDVAALLGFVVQRGAVFEATSLTAPLVVTRHVSASDALDRFRVQDLASSDLLRAWPVDRATAVSS